MTEAEWHKPDDERRRVRTKENRPWKLSEMDYPTFDREYPYCERGYYLADYDSWLAGRHTIRDEHYIM